MAIGAVKKLSVTYTSIIAVISAVFIGIILVLINIDHNTHKAQMLKDIRKNLAERAVVADSHLDLTRRNVQVTKQYLDNFLQGSHSFPVKSPLVPFLRDETGGFYSLDHVPPAHRCKVGNLIGLGSLDKIKPSRWQIEMAVRLFTAQRIEHEITDDIIWSFYLSQENFFAIYPWRSSADICKTFTGGNIRQVIEGLYQQECWKQALRQNNPPGKPFWTRASIDSSGKGVVAMYVQPIYDANNQFIGIVGAKICLTDLNHFVAADESEIGRWMIVNSHDQVLAGADVSPVHAREISRIEDILPGFKGSGSKSSRSVGASEVFVDGTYIFSQPLQAAPWHMVYTVSRTDLMKKFLPTLWLDIVLVVGLFVFFCVAHILIRRNFIRPAIELVQHIRTEATSGAGVIPANIPIAWKPWFKMVSDTLPLKSLAANLPGAVYQFVQYSDGTMAIPFVTDSIEGFLGISAEQITKASKTPMELLPKRETAGLLKAIRKSARNMVPFVYECPMLGAGGNTIQVRLMSRPRPGEKGEIIWDGLALDITDRVKVEAALARRDAIMHAISDAAERFLESSDWESIIGPLLARFGKAVQASRAYIFQNRQDAGVLATNQRFEWVASGITAQIDNPDMQGLAYDGEFAAWADILGKGEPLYGPAESFPPRIQEMFRQQEIQSIILVPIFSGQTWWGYIGFDECKFPYEWSDVEINALRTAAGVLGAAIQRKLTEDKLKQARQTEINIGSRIQQTLLFGKVPEEIPRAKMASLTIPSQEIDGDFTDFIQHDKQHLDVVLGDVMGKGVPAALLGAATKSVFLQAISTLICASHVSALPTCEEIVTLAHKNLCHQLIGLNRFVTLCYARFNLDLHRMDLVDCGHTNTLHYIAATGQCQMLQTNNMPLGFTEWEVYHQISVSIAPGDVLLFYSDGLIEARNSASQAYGSDRVVESIKANASLAPGEILKNVYGDLVNFSQSASFSDDLTCIAVKIEDEKISTPLASGNLYITSNSTELVRLRKFLRRMCSKNQDIIRSFVNQLELAANEAASNIMQHAYHEQPERKILVQADVYEDQVVVQLFHWGEPFHQLQTIAPAFDGSQEHGFGLYLIRNCVDEVNYSSEKDGKSCVRLTKRV
ncbi:MAG: SpoIIE family protein phosphatase [Phycisphaerae bacterium]|nr:SpoIIE family protein phosphatase [Phycisphaerae bacterium]